MFFNFCYLFFAFISSGCYDKINDFFSLKIFFDSLHEK